jgi:hypothetical protein
MIARFTRIFFVLILVLVLALPPLEAARADGGIVVSDPSLWAWIEEGQQIAVVHLAKGDLAKVDLFITMNDRSGQSHEVTFFVPLGVSAGNFQVVEQGSREFDEALTGELDASLRDYQGLKANFNANIRSALLLGTLTTNGLWTGLIYVPLLLSSCTAQVTPVATFSTESSQIAIYSMDESMDIQGLIETTGLDASVKDTLESLQGQQIAVVKLQTKVASSEEDDWLPSTQDKGQPGIHLAWDSKLVPAFEGDTYTYPLGTGRAWASPIELTRVYVVAPTGVDFTASYPPMGTDLSGIGGGSPWGGLASRIYWKIDTAESPAYAVDEAFGSYGHLMRLTYIKSNADRDITLTRLGQVAAATSRNIRSANAQNFLSSTTWLIALLVGLGMWLVSWRYVMPRLTGVPYSWRKGKLYGDALKWSLLYPAATIVSLILVGLVGIGFAFLLFSVLFRYNYAGSEFTQIVMGILLAVPLLVAILGLANAFFYSLRNAKRLNISRWRAFGAYLLVVLSANVLYVLFAVAYGWLVTLI